MDRKTERILNDFRRPDELTADELRARFEARDKYPAEFLAAQERKAAQERDALDREAARGAWLRNGGDEKAFDSEWREILRESKSQQMLQASERAHEAAWRRTREAF